MERGVGVSPTLLIRNIAGGGNMIVNLSGFGVLEEIATMFGDVRITGGNTHGMIVSIVMRTVGVAGDIVQSLVGPVIPYQLTIVVIQNIRYVMLVPVAMKIVGLVLIVLFPVVMG